MPGYKSFISKSAVFGEFHPVRRILKVGNRDCTVVGGVLHQEDAQRGNDGSSPLPTSTAADRLAKARTSSGTVKANTLPLPSSLSTQMRPPISSTRRFEIVSPNPEPPNLRVVDEFGLSEALKDLC